MSFIYVFVWIVVKAIKEDKANDGLKAEQDMTGFIKHNG